MDDCSKHKKEVLGCSDMEVLATLIEDMSYEVHPEFFERLANRFLRRSNEDIEDGKVGLSRNGKVIYDLLSRCNLLAQEMWRISKPFMNKK